MSNLNISVDMGRVQSSVQAAIRPAVESALATVDVKKIIEERLTKKPPKEERGDFYTMMMGRGHSEPRTLIQQFVDEGIQEIAKEFVQRELRAQKPYIEEGLRKALVASNSNLAKSFGVAIERALKEDWSFEIGVKVDHKVKEREDY